jgi:hypothetical protein
VAFIYLCGGQVLQVAQSRQEIENDLLRSDPDVLLKYEVGIPARGAQRPMPVAVVAGNIAAVADERLPNPRRA